MISLQMRNTYVKVKKVLLRNNFNPQRYYIYMSCAAYIGAHGQKYNPMAARLFSIILKSEKSLKLTTCKKNYS